MPTDKVLIDSSIADGIAEIDAWIVYNQGVQSLIIFPSVTGFKFDDSLQQSRRVCTRNCYKYGITF